MSSVEDRIVSMKFDNKQFEPNAQKSMSTLDRLKAALNFNGTNKGLNDLQNTANKFSLGGLANGAQGVSSKFLAMSAVALTAIGNIVNRAVDAGIRIAKAFTLDPLKQGFQEYETNLNSVQTILANTQASGAKLKDVNNTLQELNTYSDQTIYNFSEMARNIGTFTAAGVDLKTSAASIKGIANLAALSGSNSQQAATAMYQLSQAISSGRVGLQDWNSVVNAGMGGTVFQRALAQTAEKMGTLSKGSVELKGKMKNVTIEGKSFRESITAKPGEESWLTSDVLTKTLQQFTGDLSDAELAAEGFSKEQIKAIQAQAKTAKDAATQVKTFTQLVGTLQESAGSGYAQTAQILLGDFEEAKKLFTSISDVVGGFISKSADARNDMLQTWKDLGGRTAAIKGLENIFKAVVRVAKPIQQAFRSIFPATTGKQLYEMTQRFLAFTKTLKMGGEDLKNVKRTAAGFFAIFSIGWSIIKGLLGVLGRLFGFVSSGSGDFLKVTGSVGDFLVRLDQMIKKGDLINKFFDKLGDAFAVAVQFLKEIGGLFGGIFSGFDEGISEAIANSLDRIRTRLKALTGATSIVGKVFSFLGGIFRKIGEVLAPLGPMIGEALGGIGDAIAKAFKAGDFSSVFDALNTGLLAGLALLVGKFLKEGLNFNFDFGGGFLSDIKETFGALTSYLSAMQSQVQAKTIMTIAIAVGILAASMVALSLIDSKKLASAIAGISAAFAQLLLAMAILTKVTAAGGFLKIPFIAASMVTLSVAVLILSGAIRVLSGLSWSELIKGLTGIAGVLLLLVLTSKGLEKSSGSMLRAGAAMIPLAIGLKILASAVGDFAELSLAEMGKGLLAMAGAMVVLAGAMAIMPKSMILQAAGLVLVGVAMKIIASALGDMGGMDWGQIAKSMVVLFGALLLLAAALAAMTSGIAGAAALIVAAVALAILTPVLIAFGDMGWENIAKAMVVLFGALLLLAAGMAAMTSGIAGAAALLVITAALAVLAPILITLGAMSWESIGKGLAALAGIFLVLGLSSLVLAPLIPVILGLGAALLLLGISVALIGGGLLAIATAFTVFAAAGTAGIAILTAMIGLIPVFMAKFAEGIISFGTTLAENSAQFVAAFASLLASLLDGITLVLPKIAAVINLLIKTMLNIIISNAPRIATAGVVLITALLLAIGARVNRFVTLAGNIIIAFIRAMGNKIPQIVKVGVDLILKLMKAVQDQQVRLLNQGQKLIISFINKLASTIRANQSQMNAAARNLASALVSGMTGGISDRAWEVARAAANLVRKAIQAAKDALKINSPSKEFHALGVFSAQGLAYGMDDESRLVERSAEGLSNSALNAIRQSIEDAYSSMAGDLSMNPVITPVLDLTKIMQDAGKLTNMLDAKAISADISYRQALEIDSASSRREDSANEKSGGDTYLNFEQTIIAPKQPTLIDLYRNTNSQLSMAKEGLKNR